MAKRHCAICPSLWALTLLPVAAALTVSCPQSAEARDERRQQIDIPAATLPAAVAELSRQAGVSIGTSGALPPLRTPAMRGRMTVGDALVRLLRDSGYVARQVGATAWRIERAPAEAPAPLGTADHGAGELAHSAPILVTASKQQTDLASLPMAVAVIALPEESADVADDTASIVQSTEGMSLAGPGPGRNRIFLRGIADSAFNGETQATVAVVLDDARITYSAPDPDIRLVDMERVEVLKGPQGSLYGNGALGGIYHIVSRRPQLDETRFMIASGGEAFATGNRGYSLSAVANLPLRDGLTAVRLVGYSAREPGWVDTGAREDSNATRVSGLRAGLRADLGDAWRLDVGGFAQWLESRDSSYVYIPHARSRPAQLPEPHDNDLRHLSARLAREGGDVRIVASSGITWHEVGDRIDATEGADGFGLADPQALDNDRQYRVWDSELRLSGLSGGWRWLAGLSYLGATQHLAMTIAAAAGSLQLDNDRRTAHDLAAFGDLTIPLSGAFSLDAGARLFHSATIERRLQGDGTRRFEASRTGLTPSLAIAWRPDDRDLVWLRYGSAVRQGSTDFSDTGAIERLKADELALLEAGWRAQWPGGLRLEIGAWYGWWENVQSDLLQSDGLVESENAGDARTSGVELSVSKRLAEGWRLAGGGNFTAARLVRNRLGIELPDRHLPAVPEYTLRASLEHDFPIGKDDAGLAVALRYVGPSRLSFDPQIDRPMGELLESSVEGHVDLSGFGLVLRLENPLARNSDSFAFGNSLRFAMQRQYTPQPPARISLRLEKHF